MSDVISIDDFKKAERKIARKEKIKETLNKGLKWASENKELAAILATTTIGATAKTAKFVGKRVNLKKQEQLKDLYCYDRSLGHYWRLRRELTNSEWVEIDRRKQQGERLADILEELKVLK